MLINLSNHPSEKWGEDQKNATFQKFGDIKDYHFPEINPEATTSEIRETAQKIFIEIRNANHSEYCIHLMGEFTFCYQFARLCEINAIPCFVSTTKREVEIKENGEKISKFKFIKFRPYFDNSFVKP